MTPWTYDCMCRVISPEALCCAIGLDTETKRVVEHTSRRQLERQARGERAIKKCLFEDLLNHHKNGRREKGNTRFEYVRLPNRGWQ